MGVGEGGGGEGIGGSTVSVTVGNKKWSDVMREAGGGGGGGVGLGFGGSTVRVGNKRVGVVDPHTQLRAATPPWTKVI